MIEEVTIPNRFESLRSEFGAEVRALIVPIEDDLRALLRFRERARIQNGGLLCFLLGQSGIGKTTSAYSAVSNAPDAFGPVVTIPHDLELQSCISWITSQVPSAIPSKSTIVGVRQFLSALNQFLRRRSDVLFCWPTTDVEWHKKLRKIAENIGGANFCPKETDYHVKGPEKKDWPTVLDRLLLRFQKSLDDVGMSSALVDDLVNKEGTIGDFLGQISFAISERLSNKQKTNKLPQLLFVISSSGDVTGEANRIRRAGKQVLAAEPLLGHSPRSEAGKWWTQRNHDPNHHLGYIISLFNATLVTMTPSSVVHACMLWGADDLRATVTKAGIQANKGSAGQSLKASELFRFLSGDSVPEFTTGKKGKAQASTVTAYADIQALSSKRHKAINQAICAFIETTLPVFKCNPSSDFEVMCGRDVVTDAILQVIDRTYSAEFHHLSAAQCGASSMASYIMGKLRTYAIYHNIIPR